MSKLKKRTLPGRSDNDMLQLILDRLKARGLTVADLAKFEKVPEITRAVIAKRLEEFLTEPENYFRKDKSGKRTSLPRHEMFRNFANQYAEQVAKALGIKLLSTRARTVSKKASLLAEILQGDLSEPLNF